MLNKLFISAVVLTMLLACKDSKKEIQNTALEEAKKAIAESNAIYFESFVKNDSSISSIVMLRMPVLWHQIQYRCVDMMPHQNSLELLMIATE
jgi:hypothetical protein